MRRIGRPWHDSKEGASAELVGVSSGGLMIAGRKERRSVPNWLSAGVLRSHALRPNYIIGLISLVPVMSLLGFLVPPPLPSYMQPR
jgi:hypothetical protein